MKENIILTDEMLQNAAGEVRASMLSALPEAGDCGHSFSAGFQLGIDRLMRADRRRHAVKKAARSAAAVLLALLIGCGVWLASDTNARAAVINWVRETYESSVIYRFFGSGSETGLPSYTPSWLPEGFEATDTYADDAAHSVYYENTKTGDIIAFDYYLSDGSSTVEYITSAASAETVYVNGITADFYPAGGDSATSNLIWTDEKAGIVFCIDSSLEKAEILHIAEGVMLAN